MSTPFVYRPQVSPRPRRKPDMVLVYSDHEAAAVAAADETYDYVIEERVVRAFSETLTVYVLAFWYA